MARFSNTLRAEPLQRRLIQSGLQAELNEGLGLERFWFVPTRGAGVRIEVPAHQFERAEQLLLDWDAAEGALREAIRCPECKSFSSGYHHVKFGSGAGALL